MNNPQFHVIFGTGPVGATLAELLLSEGKRVRLLSRSGSNPLGQRSGLEVRAADASNRESAIAASQGADMIYNCVNAPYDKWAEQLAPMYRGILAAAEAAEAPLVIADNLYSYGPVTGPISEKLPLAGTTLKCKIRADLVTEMLAAHAEGRTEISIIQGSDFFGPRVINAHMGKRSFDPILKGKSAYIMGDIDQPHTFTYVPDFVRAMQIVGQRWEGFGRVWLAPNVPALSTRQFVAEAARVAGTKARAKAIPEAALFAAGFFMPVMRELRETLYQFKRPFVVDSSDFERTFGMTATPLDEALRSTLDWVASQQGARVGSPALA